NISSMRRFYFSYGVILRFRKASVTAVQMVETMREKDPSLSAEALQEFGQSVFTAESISAGDSKTYIALESLRLAQESAKAKYTLEIEKLKVAKRRVTLLEANAASAKEKLTKIISKGGITKETLAKIEEAAGLL
ncbi:MAG: hypothetical protein ABI615_01820, partial [Chthoniobacterales bacterium]